MWLLTQEIYEAIHPSPEARANARAVEFNASAEYEITGADAVINVKGVLTPTPSLMAALFGGGNTTYSSIINAITAAENDPQVSRIVFSIDSPGGTVAGLFNTLDAIKAASKPTVARVSGQAASAAYGIAAATGRIEASSRGDIFGSVGVVIQGYDDKNAYTITSSGAKNKRPDHNTPEGMAEIQRKLDEMEALFVDYISAGRGIAAEELMDRFGNGSTFLSQAALERGMIDSISTQTNNNANEETSMDVNKLKAEHPALFDEIKALGASEAMSSVKAHIIRAEACDALDVAAEAIKAGAGMTDEYKAKYDNAYLAHSVNKQNSDAESELKGKTDDVKTDDGSAASKEEQELAFAELLVANLQNEGVL